LTNKPDEGNAIFAKRVFVFLFCPIDWGDPERGGLLSSQARTVFRWVRRRLFVLFKRRGRQYARETETRTGGNCGVLAPSAGIALKPSPNEREAKADLRARTRYSPKCV
jgi:hypothetical protein